MIWVAALAGPYIAGCVLLALRRATVTGTFPATSPGRVRLVAPGALLIVLALMTGLLFRPVAPVVVLMAAAGITAVFRPAAARRLLPFALIALGLFGLVLLRQMARNRLGIYVHLPPVAHHFYGLVDTGDISNVPLVLLQMWAFLLAGGYLAGRQAASSSSRLARALWVPRDGEPGVRQPRWGLLLLPVLVLLVELISMTRWFGASMDWAVLAVVTGAAALLLIAMAPAVAADLALVGVVGLGLYGVAVALLGQHPGFAADPVYSGFPWIPPVYGLVSGIGGLSRWPQGLQGLAILAFGVCLVPRALDARTRSHFWPAAARLQDRVERLTQTRADAVDTAAAELRRVERDLHDGAQARLVAVGMSLRAAERLFASSPQAALELISEARESSSKALTELRDLVRGIYPPVLADRGLADAVRALALDTPLPTDVRVDLSGRPDAPVESACYFAVAEALTNAVRHAGARRVQVSIRHAHGMLRIEVSDDGTGGADPVRGSGLRGIEQRLAAFDGILAVSSPPGGPTMIVIEVPCALSSPKTSTC
ncbi:MAG TPA: histidine kinase [Streptosporangiaceae bacterium]